MDNATRIQELQAQIAQLQSANGTGPPGPLQQAQAATYGMLPGMVAMPGMMGAAQPMMQPMGMQPMMGMAQSPLQPTSISIPITAQLPDGRTVDVRLHFDGGHAANLQAFLAMALQVFGPMLKAWMPRQNSFGGGYGYGGGYQNGGRGWGRRY